MGSISPSKIAWREVMDDETSPRPHLTEQGVALVDLVIERVRNDPYSITVLRQYPLLAPKALAPEAIAALALPSGKPLPPSVLRWLAFDASWLAQFNWLTTLAHPQLTPRRLEAVVADGLEYRGWAKDYRRLGDHFDECFLLPPFGEETCRILVVSEPDERGEYPILVADVDDTPALDLVYPGFDVYLASIARLPIPQRRDADVTWTTLFAVPPYRERLTQHARHLFGGQREVLVDARRPEGYECLPLGDDETEDERPENSDGRGQEGDELPF
jgi:hypothetical protein